MQGNLPPEAQEKFEELQNLQETTQNVSEQKQSSESALNGAQTAPTTLEEIDGDSQMYREVGELLIEIDYESAKDDLEEKVESLEARVEQLTKQETRVQGELESLQEELQQMLQGGVGGAGPIGPGGAQMSQPANEEVVEIAAEATEGLILARFKQSCVKDFDVTVTFEGGVLDVGMYVSTPDDTDDVDDAEAVVEEAALMVQEAVDELFAAVDEEQGMLSRAPPAFDVVR